jgi:hypothetical protein
MNAAGMPIAVSAPPPLQDSCHGCTHNWYSAPGGQAHNREPHSRCLFFARDIPMLVERDRWYGSTIPPACPTFAQGTLL